MATIKKLKLKLKSGLLSELQSDTIFGHFAWRFKDEHGEEKLTEFLNLFLDKTPVFTISDGFFEKGDEVFFPKPLKLTPPKFENKGKTERIKEFIKQKESKSRKLVTLDQLNLYIKGELNSFENLLAETDAKDYPEFKQSLRVSVEIDRETFQSKTGQLFSYNPKYLDDNTYLSIFVKIIDQDKWNEFNCEKVLRSVFEVGYGKKKSSGYGQFEIINFEDFFGFNEPGNANGFITLSQYLPANVDGIKDAYYDINVKYGKLGEEKSNSQNPFKKPLLLLAPGSCFITDINREFYGRAVNEVIDYLPNVIHNGIAFTLKCKFE